MAVRYKGKKITTVIPVTTYGIYEEGAGDRNMVFYVPRKWLSEKVFESHHYINLTEFLDSYTFDDVIGLDDRAEEEGVLKGRYCSTTGRPLVKVDGELQYKYNL